MADSRKTVLAFVSGAAIGAALGLLYAPEKGEDTRKRLCTEADKARGKMKEQWGKTSSNLSAQAKKTKANFDEKLEDTLSSASYKAEDILVALGKRLEELREKNKKFQKKAKPANPEKKA